MALEIFTLVHVLISLAALFAGFGALAGLLAGKLFPGWTALFLAATVATSATGFFFPFRGFTPAYAVGALSILLLGVAIYAWYARRLAGAWRKTYVLTAVTPLYLNVFVLIAQLFQKIPALQALAPTQSAPAFGLAQGLVLVAFVALTVAAARRFRPSPASSV